MKNFKSMAAAAALGIGFISGQPAVAALYDFANGSSGTLYTGGGSGLTQVIPDNTQAGVGYSINFAGTGLNLSDISITLTLSGGYNGDLYAYLSHGSQIAVLFNQITGTAASGSGFSSVILTTGTGSTIQTVSGTAGAALTGSYTAQDNLATFNTTDASGAWTIFFADLSPGDTSTLNSFSIGITAVPEPVNAALWLMGAMFTLAGGYRWWVRRRMGGLM